MRKWSQRFKFDPGPGAPPFFIFGRGKGRAPGPGSNLNRVSPIPSVKTHPKKVAQVIPAKKKRQLMADEVGLFFWDMISFTKYVSLWTRDKVGKEIVLLFFNLTFESNNTLSTLRQSDNWWGLEVAVLGLNDYPH